MADVILIAPWPQAHRMAEVSLTIGGVDEEHLNAAGVEMALYEVTVSGESFAMQAASISSYKTLAGEGHPDSFHGHGRSARTSLQHHGQGNITQIFRASRDRG